MSSRPVTSAFRFLACVCLAVAAAASADPVRIVDFGHDWGVGFPRSSTTKTSASTFDLDQDGVTTDDVVRGWAYDFSTPLSPSDSGYEYEMPSAKFYGAIMAGISTGDNSAPTGTAQPSEGHINQNHELRDDWNLMALPRVSGQPEVDSFVASGLWFWKKEDFLNGASTRTVSFDASSYISVFVSRYWGGLNWGRWIVRDSGQFYVSEPTFGNLNVQFYVGMPLGYGEDPAVASDAGVSNNPITKTAHTIRPTQVNWAPYNPSAPFNTRFDPSAATFAPRTFANVEAVGFLVQRDLQVGAQVSTALSLKEPIAFKFNAVQVVANVADRPASAYLNLVPVGGTPTVPNVWAARNEVTYEEWLRVFRWADSNQRARDFSDGVDRYIPPYVFERDGGIGSAEASLATHSPQEPVTTITWYDSLIWCNALSELEGLEPVYYEDAAYTKPLRRILTRNILATAANRPVVYWKNTAAGYRLPTSGEWKTLAADASTADASAWNGTNASGKTQVVATKAANSLGLYDMVGNVSEYVWDVAGAMFDPSVNTTHTVLGGSFRLPADENASSLIPFGERPWSGSPTIGFRPVRNGAASIASGSGSFPERTYASNLVVPAASPMGTDTLRTQVLTELSTVIGTGKGTLGPGSTNGDSGIVTAATAYDLEIGRTEISYRTWTRVKQWAERTQGYVFNYSGDVGSARFRTGEFTRSANEPVTQLSWFDAVIWCNALSELAGLEPVYRKQDGSVERSASPFRLSMYERYAYPNTGSYVGREIDTAMIYDLRPDPVKNGFRLPTLAEAQGIGPQVTVTEADGWFSTNSGGKAQPVGTKAASVVGTAATVAGLYDLQGNVEEWCYGGSTLFGQNRYSNNFATTRSTYQLSMNRMEHVSVARPFLGFRVVRAAGNGNLPPGFTTDPVIAADAVSTVAYSGSLVANATDPNPADVMTFAKVSGPSWLTVSSTGALSGTPALADAGLNTFVVRVSDTAGLTATATLQIAVSATPPAPSFNPATGTFEGQAVVTLSATLAGCTFRYTTDGSTPSDMHGTATAGSLTLGTLGDVTVRAVSIYPGLAPSSVSTATYSIVAGQPPVITSQPASATLGLGWSHVLSVVASGTGTSTYQWFLGSQPISGATGASYTIASAAQADSGNYTCVVTNPYGTAVSSVATVTAYSDLTSSSADANYRPTPLVLNTQAGVTAQHTFYVRNTGLADLVWTLSLPSGASGAYSATRSMSGGPAYAWREIASTADGGTRLTALNNGDDSVTTLSFPSGFVFPFYGTNYSSVSVCTNGFVNFGTATNVYANYGLPSSNAPSGLVAPLWDDLKLDASASVWWRADSDALVITWNAVGLYTNTASRQTFQLLLFRDGTIRFQYKTLTAAHLATVGIQNIATNSGVQVSYNSSTTLPVNGEAVTIANPPGWITGGAPLSGTTAGRSETAVTLMIDATGMTAGSSRSATLTLASNDPDTPSLAIPITLNALSSVPLAVSTATLPDATVGTAYAATLVHAGGTGAVSWSVASGSLPAGLSLAAGGAISGTPTVHGTYSFTVRVTDSASATATKPLTITVAPPPPPVISTSALGSGSYGAAYAATLQATGGLAPLSWSLVSGALPSGLSLSSAGVISGTPTVVGSFSITVRVTDSYAQSGTKALTLDIAPPPTLEVVTAILPTAVLAQSYSVSLTASGGYGGYSWSVSGALPPGVSMNSAGSITGTPTAAGSYPLTLTVTDSHGQSASKSLPLIVAATVTGRPAVVAGGWNLTDVSYWNNASMFADLMLSSSEWQHNWATYAFEYDSRGYPVNIPAGVTPGTKITLFEPGDYVLTWIGDGQVRLENTTMVGEDLTGSVKRRVYRKTTPISTSQLVRVQIMNQVAATDIHVWVPGAEPADVGEPEIFHSEFLARLRDNTAVLRFMDWGKLNSSTFPLWSARRRADYYTQQSPTAYETMIRLANRTDKDMWINIPHTVHDLDPTYIDNLARLILTGMDGSVQVCEPLKPGLKVYVEWSNEVWNSTFPQYTWAVDKAKARLGVTTLSNYDEVWRIIGEYNAITFKKFRAAFSAASRPSDLVCVLGTQIGGGLVAQHMNGVNTIANADPDAAARPLYRPDVVAIGAYYGHDLHTWLLNTANVADLSAPTAANYTAAFAQLDSLTLGTYRTSLLNSAAAAAAQSLPLVAYEGGQHIVGTGSAASNNALTTFLNTMNRDSRMGDSLALALNLWEEAGGGLFMAYLETGPYSNSGSWGFREYWYQSLSEAPKAAAYAEWLRRMQQSHFISRDLDDAKLGYGYSFPLDIEVRDGPITCSVSSGALPLGLAISASGVVSGIPRDYGDFAFTLSLVDGAGRADSRSYAMTVATDRLHYEISPAADAHVYSVAGNTGTNYGASTTFAAHTSSIRYTYLRWDLSFLSGRTVRTATLKLTRSGTTTATTGTLLSYTPQTAWDETTLTWLTRPAVGSSFTTFPISTTATAHSADVTAWVTSNRGDAAAGFAFTADQYSTWASKENTTIASRPLLVIDADPELLVPTLWANWSQQYFGNTGAVAAADYDGDGLSNLLEYALGGNPAVAGTVPAHGLAPASGNRWVFITPYHPLQHDRRFRVMGSADLATWTDTLFDSRTDYVAGTDWVTLQVDCTSRISANPGRYFVRVVVDPSP